MSMLLGCLLGDAFIGRTKDKSFISFEQSIKNEEYVLSIYKDLKDDLKLK
jgi:hypothetical protein